MRIKIGILDLGELLDTENIDSCVEKLLAMVHPERQARICRFHQKEDRLRSLGAEHLLLTMLREVTSLSDTDLPLVYRKGTQGKPSVEGHPEWIWNLSHAGRLAACALAIPEGGTGARIPAVGVDVQDWRGIREAVGRRCFTEKEIGWYQSFLQPEMQENAFYQLWTLKESLIKTNGMGMTFPMKQVEFTISRDRNGQRKTVALRQDGEAVSYSAAVYEMGLPYGLAVCAEGHNVIFPEQPVWYRMDGDGQIQKV